ncbi:BTAD domain-containing putative transcriptional regulator [Micromonospora sp. NPDC049559]|uniref:AfsR/SARP family transcriptional regulator n=1 Tax=Micromonospora sp. NPDC049559 TaxID=3155923 RepID=UPI00342FB19F
MVFRVLGPVAAPGADAARLGSRKQRLTLAVLLCHAGEVVSADRLVQALWDDDPPRTAYDNLRLYVYKLRQVVGRDTIRRFPAGYLLDLPHGELDLHRFDDLVHSGDQAVRRGATGTAARRYGEALALWRGPAYGDLAEHPALRDEANRLYESRLTVLGKRIDADLALGRHAEIVAELTTLAARHPLRERLQGQLMLALYRAQRQADALAVFARAREVLADELGVDPGPALTALHERILRADPALAEPGHPLADGPPAGAAAGTDRAGGTGHRPGAAGRGSDGSGGAGRSGGPGAAGRGSDGSGGAGRSGAERTGGNGDRGGAESSNTLPRDVPDFTGRQEELDRLLAVLDTGRGEAGAAVVISAIDGMAGIGKTALAVRAAHRLAGDYPDAQLFVDLHAHTADQQPRDPAAALDLLLRSLGVPAEQIPDGVDQRAARWRAELAGRRALVVLDNAASAGQVRPLLPGTPGCLVLVTSRNRLVDLEAAQTLALDVLPPAEAAALFARIVGEQRSRAEPAAVDEAVALCGRLPLAIRVAAARLRHRRGWSVAHLVERLRDTRYRLRELQAGEHDIAAAFDLSYRQLDAAHRRLFRLLGLHPGPGVDPYAAAALAGTPPRETERLLEDLLDVHLLQQDGPDRYHFHDLVREYAKQRAEAEEPPERRRAAITRLADHYLGTVRQAVAYIYPNDAEVVPAPDGRDAVPRTFDGYEQALAWCDRECANLVAIVRGAAEQELLGHAWQLPRLLWSYFYLRKRWADWLDAVRVGLAATRALGDRAGEGQLLNNLGIVHDGLSQHQAALEAYRRALVLCREVEDRRGERAALINLGVTYRRLGRFDDALSGYHQALAMCRANGDRRGEVVVLMNIGNVHNDLRRHAEALRCLREALAMGREIGDRNAEGRAHTSLGETFRHLGDHAASREHLERAVETLRTAGDRWGSAEALNLLGQVRREAGDHGGVRESWREALAIFSELGDPQADAVRAQLAALDADGTESTPEPDGTEPARQPDGTGPARQPDDAEPAPRPDDATPPGRVADSTT